MKTKYRVITKTSEKDRPYDFEMSASELVAEYFKCNVIFLRPTPLKSPDLLIKGQTWELKSPIGDGKCTIHNSIHGARKQSVSLIIDLRRCKMYEEKAIGRIRDCFKKRRRKSGTYLVIRKNGNIVDIRDYI